MAKQRQEQAKPEATKPEATKRVSLHLTRRGLWAKVPLPVVDPMSEAKRHFGLSVVVALALAWLAPGLGHIYLGRRIRGAIILATIALTFWAGIAIGGTMTVDDRTERWWFAADMVTGVHGLVSWQRSDAVNRRIDLTLELDAEYQHATEALRTRIIGAEAAVRRGQDAAANKKKLEVLQAELEQIRNQYAGRMLDAEGLAVVSPVDNVARAYCGVAGLLNLMCIFDAILLAQIGVRGEPPPAEPKPEAAS